jgi:hypothetical protein
MYARRTGVVLGDAEARRVRTAAIASGVVFGVIMVGDGGRG